jgi:methionine biosynthesis protein MetW
MPLPEAHPFTDTFTTASVLIPTGSSVLDVGCGRGAFARHLTTYGCPVTGIDINDRSVAEAAQWCVQAIAGDVETLDLAGVFGDEIFDVITCLDVLEHLKDPAATLRRLVGMLHPGGRVVVSIPNVTHAAVRLQLLQGSFARTENGLLDRTHLQFFDRSGLEDMIVSAGMVATDRLYVRRAVEETEIDLDWAEISEDAVATAASGEDADVYQFVWSLAPSSGQPSTLGMEALWFELETARAEIGRLRLQIPAESSVNRAAAAPDLEWQLGHARRVLKQRDEVARQAHAAKARSDKQLALARKVLTKERKRLSYRATRRAIIVLRRIPPLWWALRLIRPSLGA